MDIIDKNKDLSTEDEVPIGSYHNMEGLRRSIQPNQPSKMYDYGNHIHTSVYYTRNSLKKV